MYVCPYLDQEVADPYSLSLPPRENKVIIPTIFGLLVLVSFDHYLHPFFTFQLCL